MNIEDIGSEHMLGWMTLLLFTTAAVVRDTECYRIPNGLLLAGALNGLILRAIEGGFVGVMSGIISGIIPFAFCGLLFILSMLGAGDIKLLMAIGVYMNVAGICRVMAVAFIVGAVWSLVLLTDRRMLVQRMAYLRDYYHHLREGHRVPYIDMGANLKVCNGFIHFSVPILSAVIYEMIICSI